MDFSSLEDSLALGQRRTTSRTDSSSRGPRTIHRTGSSHHEDIWHQKLQREMALRHELELRLVENPDDVVARRQFDEATDVVRTLRLQRLLHLKSQQNLVASSPARRVRSSSYDKPPASPTDRVGDEPVATLSSVEYVLAHREDERETTSCFRPARGGANGTNSSTVTIAQAQAAQLEALAKLSPPRDPIDAQVAGQESASVPDLLTLSKRMAFRVGSAPLQSFASDDADWNTELETEMRKLDHDS